MTKKHYICIVNSGHNTFTTMGKYNITEKKEKEAAYRSLINPTLMDELKEKILDIILIQKKIF